MNNNSSTGNQPFGQTIKTAQSTIELFILERRYGKHSPFNVLDGLVGELVFRAMRGERIAELGIDSAKNALVLQGVSSEQQKYVEDTYCVEAQQARGAWYLPDEVVLKIGPINLPFNFRIYERFATTVTYEDKGKLVLADNPNIVLAWSVLEPLFNMLFLPFELRGSQAGIGTREEQLQKWEKVDEFYSSLGYSVSEQLAAMRYGSGWHRLRAAQQIEVKKQLLTAIEVQTKPMTLSLYRLYRFQELVTQYYKKAKNGRVLRRHVITKPLQRTLSGFFAGNWMSLLAYLDEEPHPDEQVVQALPTPRLFTTGTTHAIDAAAKLGIPAEEAKRIMSSLWQDVEGNAPLEKRVAALSRFWNIFDDLHSQHKSRIESLWGLVEDRPLISLDETHSPYQPQLYRHLLPTDLLEEIDQLWGTTMLPQWPGSIVTQPFPHYAMAEAFGPALQFWHGCALTTWFVIDGSSRTDIQGLRQYYNVELAALNEAGTPVDLSLFEELIQADKSLGLEQPIYDEKIKHGFSLQVSFSSIAKRTGFEKLRDIVTRFRRAWTSKYFKSYIRDRWERELKQAHRDYNVLLHERGKPPTAKQFARAVAPTTNHWFGGNLFALYTAIGEKCPIETQRKQLMPTNKEAFVKAVLDALYTLVKSHGHPIASNSEHQFMGIAEMCLKYVQVEEALGNQPRRQEFTALNNEYYWRLLANDLDAALSLYAQAIKLAKRSLKREL
jgi:hypothetical protein